MGKKKKNQRMPNQVVSESRKEGKELRVLVDEI